MASITLIQPSATPETVLIVEGDVLVRIMLSGYLKACGYRVLQAANADEALVLLEEEFDTPIDIILCEVSISGELDGFGLAQWIRKNRPEVPVILVGTPSGAADAAAELCNSGPNPSDVEHPEIILQRIKRLLAERSQQKGQQLGAALAR